MKNRIMTMAVGILMVCLLPLAAYAQQQEWQSTSTMQGAGSAYSPQVTAVGAAGVSEMATTTYSPAKAPTGPRRVIDTNNEWEEGDQGSPIGDAVLPLLAMLAIYCATRVYRLRRL